MTKDEQYRVVYEGILAVAQRCDGALSLDGVGFSGQDTLFGKRIASVPFEQWTEDVKAEAARIALTYKAQILNYTGVDVATLDVVREARGLPTNHLARNDARGYERRQRNAHVIDERKVDYVNGSITIFWARKDPDFGALLDAVRALPNRQWTGAVWSARLSAEAIDFVLTHDFPLTPAAQVAVDTFKAQPAAPVEEVPNIVLDGKDTVAISAPYDSARVIAARNLPGRHWNGARKVDIVDLHPAVLSFAKEWNLKVAPEVLKALDALQATKISEETVEDMLAFASRQANPENLPPAFEALVAARRAR